MRACDSPAKEVSSDGRHAAQSAMKEMEDAYKQMDTPEECYAYIDVVEDYLYNFLLTQRPPADFTFALANPDFTNGSEGWNGSRL